ncbi:uncharacterized protein [Aegilops tauschii subsp. strangulata]|uniref:uncharacterized protein n=1 Tax=Aegilops tauschii subsp. strangulata TaxID=200361 RepID=UPI00098A32D8|nr:uncharacterized protein LOC109745120 [Aegilops tauschii subsp. strangulata]
MTKLGLEAKDLEPSRTVFHGIVLGLSCSPIGRIWLEILFVTSDHFCHEPIWFELVDLSSAYHALLGRHALAKFMAVPHYAYLKMKLPGPKGLITVVGDYRKSLECAQAGTRLAESLVIAEERRQLDRIIALANEMSVVPASAKELAGEASFQPSKETKKVKLNPEDPSCTKYVVVGARLDSK